jgi:hypothetical protein
MGATCRNYARIRHTWPVTELFATATAVNHGSRAVESNRLAGQATGVLIATYRVDADRAWQLLHRTSQQSNVKVRHLARAIVVIAGGEDEHLDGLDPRAAHVVRTRLLPPHVRTNQPPTAPGELSRRDRRALGAARDALAVERDERASIRDQAAEVRDRVAASPPDGAAEDRASSASDRAASATDRAIAAEDRRAP